MCWDSVDFENQIFWVARTWSGSRLEDCTKGGAALAMPIIRPDLFADAAKVYTGMDTIPGGEMPVFFNPVKSRNGQHPNPLHFYKPEFLRTTWKRAMIAAGLKPLPLYNGTRHSLAMRLKYERVDDATIARILGHRTNGQHVRKYARADVRAIRDVLK